MTEIWRAVKCQIFRIYKMKIYEKFVESVFKSDIKKVKFWISGCECYCWHYYKMQKITIQLTWVYKSTQSFIFTSFYIPKNVTLWVSADITTNSWQVKDIVFMICHKLFCVVSIQRSLLFIALQTFNCMKLFKTYKIQFTKNIRNDT